MGKDKSTTSTTSVDPTTLARQQQLWNSANKLPSSYTPYSGDLTAQTTDQQQSGYNQIAGASGQAQPGINAAMGLAAQAGRYSPQQINAQGYNAAQANGAQQVTAQNIGLGGYNPNNVTSAGQAPNASAQQASFQYATPDQINGLLNPYTQNVVDTTNSDIERTRQQQIAQGQAQATAAGAFGGSRHGVSDSLTNEAALRTTAAQDAGLRSAGYSQALNSAIGQNATNAGVSQTNAGLGTQASIANANAGVQTNAQSLQAQMANQNAGYQGAALNQQGGIANQGANLTAGLANASNAQNLGLANANYLNAAGQFNAGQGNAAAQANQGAGLQGAGLNLTAANSLGNLGIAGQNAALQGANANIQAGTQQQQTNQAGDTANYNQWLQKQQFPYQYQQFLQGFQGTPGQTNTKTQKGNLFGDILGAAGSIGGALLKHTPAGAVASTIGGSLSGDPGNDTSGGYFG